MPMTQPSMPAAFMALAMVMVDWPFQTPTSTTTWPPDAAASRRSDGWLPFQPCTSAPAAAGVTLRQMSSA